VDADDERALLGSLRAGDEAAFEKLVREHAPRMLAVARRFLRDEEAAQDAVQDAFLSAFRGLGDFQGGARIGTWLHRIVVNAALMKLRSRRRKPEEAIDELLPRWREDGHPARPAGPWSADRVLESEELRARVRAGIEQLPDAYREVLLLRDIEEYDTEETANLLGVSSNAVKTRLHRARQALREVLDPALRER
jgi:RNA polymerase sigma-70 factor (ECF subfamily)